MFFAIDARYEVDSRRKGWCMFSPCFGAQIDDHHICVPSIAWFGLCTVFTPVQSNGGFASYFFNRKRVVSDFAVALSAMIDGKVIHFT